MAYTIVNLVPTLEDGLIPQLRLNHTRTLNLNHLNLKTTITFYLRQLFVIDLIDRTDSYHKDIEHMINRCLTDD